MTQTDMQLQAQQIIHSVYNSCFTSLLDMKRKVVIKSVHRTTPVIQHSKQCVCHDSFHNAINIHELKGSKRRTHCNSQSDAQRAPVVLSAVHRNRPYTARCGRAVICAMSYKGAHSNCSDRMQTLCRTIFE